MNAAIYLLCEAGEDQGHWDVIGWSDNQSELAEAAERMEWERYRAREAEYRGSMIAIRAPDKTSYRRYFVMAVERFKDAGVNPHPPAAPDPC